MRLSLTILILALLVAAPPARAATATTLDGQIVSGEISRWTLKYLELRTSDGTKRLSADELIEVLVSPASIGSAAGKSSMVGQLVDDSRLRLDAFSVAGGHAKLSSKALDLDVELPNQPLRSIDFRPRTNPDAEAWKSLDAPRAGEDVLIVGPSGGESLDYLTGVVGDVTDEKVDFDWDGEQAGVKRSKIASIGFARRREGKLPLGVAAFDLADGSRLIAASISQTGEMLKIATPAGLKLAIPLAQVLRADYSLGKIAYLGELPPMEFRWMPYMANPPAAKLLAAQGALRKNQSYGGSAISLRMGALEETPRLFVKGIALRSRSTVVYRVPAGMSRFRALAGIDPATAGEGNVSLEIRGNDAVLWQGDVDGHQAAVEIDVALADAHRLEIVVDYGDNLDYGDRLHLAEARFTK